MNESYHPYDLPEEPELQAEEEQPQTYRQPPVAPVAPVAPRQPQQPYMPPRQPQMPQYPQQQFTNNPRPVPRRDTGMAAKVFGMVSFIIGCFVLPVTTMIYFNFRSTVTVKFSASVMFGMFLSVPAIVFGVVALMKKTEKRLFPILGISFGAVLLLCGFITYFFMVNGGGSVTILDY